MHLEDELLKRLNSRKKSGNFRVLPGEIIGVDFFSNDYLGLSTNSQLHSIIESRVNSITGYSLGATGSRLISGNNRFFTETENELADFFKSEATLLFNSGYNANTALLQSIPQKSDTILMDELCHASLKEGARLSFAKKLTFKHNSIDDLKKKLEHCQGNVFVVIETVYSMDGDICPLKDFVELAKEKGIYLIVDEAHSTGVFGEKGEGYVVGCGLESAVFARVHTFGKAIGAHGALIAGSRVLTEYLVNFGMSFIYTTAMPLHSILTISEAIRFQSNNSVLRETLQNRISQFSDLAQDFSGYVKSESPIQVIKIKGNKEVDRLANRLLTNEMIVKAVKSPTVKKDQERIRICLHSFNTKEEINYLIKELRSYL